MPDKMKLFTMIGDYPNTHALRSGAIKSDLVDYDFDDVKVPNRAFKPLVREAKYDCSELAINTLLQAKYYDKPYVLLPATVVGRGQIHNLVYNSERGVVRPTELHGKRVGVRAYTQTTGMWVRGMLAELYGMDVEKVNWVTFEDGHVAEYKDPPFVTRAAPGKELAQMLIDGEIDAGIITDRTDPRFKMVVPDAEEVGRKWAETHGGVPINHMVMMRKSIVQERPDVAREVFRNLLASRRAMDPVKEGKLDPLRFGIENVRKSLELAIEMSLVQKFIFRKLSVDELFDDTTRVLAG
ncbi:MAG TPA: phosphate ABC transporter substrate-binding protein [Xanthobacteraceae bacterium]|jgi:4,5-dihydroxyphthalate decarboxylase